MIRTLGCFWHQVGQRDQHLCWESQQDRSCVVDMFMDAIFLSSIMRTAQLLVTGETSLVYQYILLCCELKFVSEQFPQHLWVRTKHGDQRISEKEDAMLGESHKHNIVWIFHLCYSVQFIQHRYINIHSLDSTSTFEWLESWRLLLRGFSTYGWYVSFCSLFKNIVMILNSLWI